MHATSFSPETRHVVLVALRSLALLLRTPPGSGVICLGKQCGCGHGPQSMAAATRSAASLNSNP